MSPNFTPIASGRFQLNGIPWVATQLFLLKSTGIMPLILCERALDQFRQQPPNWILLINITSMSTSAQRPWQAFMNYLPSFSYMFRSSAWTITFLFPYSISFENLRLQCIWKIWQWVGQIDRLISFCILFGCFHLLFLFFFKKLFSYATPSPSHKDAHKTVKTLPSTKKSSTATTKARRPTQALKSRRPQLTFLTETGAWQTSTQGTKCPIGTFQNPLATSSRKHRRLIASAASRCPSRVCSPIGVHTGIVGSLWTFSYQRLHSEIPNSSKHKSGKLQPISQERQFCPIKYIHKQFFIIGESGRRRFRIMRNHRHLHIKRHHHHNSTLMDSLFLMRFHPSNRFAISRNSDPLVLARDLFSRVRLYVC